MTKTPLEMTSDELSQYNSPKSLYKSLALERWDKAWELVPKLASLLREKFGATKVVVFGSLTQRESYTQWSDIDLAAWDIPPAKYFAAVAAMIDFSPEFDIDLVDPKRGCCPSIQRAIEKGIEA
jgi:uncharacterized protein